MVTIPHPSSPFAVHALKERIPDVEKKLLDELFKKPWVVYAKRPFAYTNCVIEYLGRYTHKIAISNHRIKNIDENSITFSCKDYRKEGQKFDLTLDNMEFVRRFSMHILPKGFVRIRHYGILSSSCKKSSLHVIRKQLPQQVKEKTDPRVLTLHNPKLCPVCKTETMITIELFDRRGPPVRLCEWPVMQIKNVQ